MLTLRRTTMGRRMLLREWPVLFLVLSTHLASAVASEVLYAWNRSSFRDIVWKNEQQEWKTEIAWPLSDAGSTAAILYTRDEPSSDASTSWTGRSADGRHRLRLSRRQESVYGLWESSDRRQQHVIIGPVYNETTYILQAALGPPRPETHQPSPKDDDNEESQRLLSLNTRQTQATSTIGLMVPWSTRAECELSQLASGCTSLTATTEAAMRTLIDQAVESTNRAFTDSGVRIVLELVHAYRADNSFNEINSFSTVEQLAAPFDGVLDNVMEQRTQFGADLVVMLVADPTGCGNSFVGFPAPTLLQSYAAVAWDCAVPFLSFAHEVGHLLGCEHDRAIKDECDRTDRSNYGYRSPTGRFRDIMATECNQGGQCGNDVSSSGCPRIPLFSHAGSYIDEDGINQGPVGNALNTCVQQMNAVAATAAALVDDPTVTNPMTPAPTPAPTPRPSPSPTPAPTPAPSPAPTPAPTPDPSPAPTPAPSPAPTPAPISGGGGAILPATTPAPTPMPVQGGGGSIPSVVTTSLPTRGPTSGPTLLPTALPTIAAGDGTPSSAAVSTEVPTIVDGSTTAPNSPAPGPTSGATGWRCWKSWLATSCALWWASASLL